MNKGKMLVIAITAYGTYSHSYRVIALRCVSSRSIYSCSAFVLCLLVYTTSENLKNHKDSLKVSMVSKYIFLISFKVISSIMFAFCSCTKNKHTFYVFFHIYKCTCSVNRSKSFFSLSVTSHLLLSVTYLLEGDIFFLYIFLLVF